MRRLLTRPRRQPWAPRLDNGGSGATGSHKNVLAWIERVDPNSGRRFWFNPKTFETTTERPATDVARYKRPQYATDWTDPRFPDWVEFMELNTRRRYYLNRATGHVQWAQPGSDSDVDVFTEEIARARAAVSTIASDAPAAPLGRRLAAAGVDLGFSCLSAAGFVAVVFFDLGRLGDALPSAPFVAWLAFLARDSLFELGTRSPGKRVMGLEIVRWNGALPSRRHTLLRQVYLPVYAGATLLMPYVALLPAVDLGMVLFTARSLRLGDVLARTRVVVEQPLRAERVAERRAAMAADELHE